MLSDSYLKRLLRTDQRVDLFGDLLRVMFGLVVVALVWTWLGYHAGQARQMFVQVHMNDFGKFYYATRLYLAGQPMYGPTPATTIEVNSVAVQNFWDLNPPHFHLIVLPLALLPSGLAFGVWTALNLAALVASLLAIARVLRIPWSRRVILWTTIAVVVLSPTGMIVSTGQLTFLLMLPLTLAWAAARRGEDARAAVWLGLAASVKPTLALLWVYFLLRRSVAAAWVTVATAATAFGVGLAVFGLGAHLDWWRVIRAVDWHWVPMNASLAGIFGRSLMANPRFMPIADVPGLIPWLMATSAVGVVAVTIWRLRDSSRVGIDRQWAGLFLATLLAAPLGWMYYLWAAAGPLAGLWPELRASSSRIARACILLSVPGLLWPSAMAAVWRYDAWGALVFGSLYTWTVLLLWTAVVWESRRSAAVA